MVTVRYKTLIEEMMKATPYLSYGTAGGALDALLVSILTHLQMGNAVELRGIGRISTRIAAARLGYNPATKVKVQIPSKRRIKFTQDKTLHL